MNEGVPVLLSYYALSNGKETMVFGQLTVSSLQDFTFTAFNRRKTFRTLLALYRTKLFSNEEISLDYEQVTCSAKTDSSGAFFFKTSQLSPDNRLSEIRLSSGSKVVTREELYSLDIHNIYGSTILISDIDDTLLHSYVSRRFLKFRTLMFTSLEKRKAVVEMMKVVLHFSQAGVQPFYLSNSEQNLYPLIYRFLRNNNFPKGPLFLRQMRLLHNVFKRKDIRQKDVHKLSALQQLCVFFPDKKFILAGDNTQNDLAIYLQIAEQFPDRVVQVIIRQVQGNRPDLPFSASVEKLKSLGIPFHFGESFPDIFTAG